MSDDKPGADEKPKTLLERIKGVIEYIGLIPTIVGLFKLTPQWFTPSEFYQPDIYYWAVGAAVATFVSSYVYFLSVRGPVENWKKADRRSHFIQAIVALLIGVLSGAAYMYVVREYQTSSFIIDLVQFATFAGVFVAATFALTALGCIWKAPKTSD